MRFRENPDQGQTAGEASPHGPREHDQGAQGKDQRVGASG